MKNLIEFFQKVGTLKNIKRAGWVLRGISNPESVAEHSFRTTIMVLLLADESKLNKDKCLKMALVHDLCESLSGDITPYDGLSLDEKKEIEKNSLKKMLKNIDGKEIMELWKEYAERKTPEAVFVWEVDKLETLLQAYEYEQKKENKKIDLSEFWDNAENKVKDKKLLQMIKILKNKKFTS